MKRPVPMSSARELTWASLSKQPSRHLARGGTTRSFLNLDITPERLPSKLLLALASTMNLGSESHKTHDHIFTLCRIWEPSESCDGSFIPGAEPSVSVKRRMGGTQSRSGRCGEEDNLLPLPEILTPQSSHYPGSSTEMRCAEVKWIWRAHSWGSKNDTDWLNLIIFLYV
jgi:hypothetical protein